VELHEQRFDTHFASFFDERLSQIADLSRTSNEYVTQVLGEDNPLVKLLKASCNQAIVSPVWVNIKMNILKDFPFKDIKHGWKIYIFFHDDEIEIIHRKREQSFNKESQKEDFLFVWELKLLFSKNMESFKSATYAITDITHHEDIDNERRQNLLNTIRLWRSSSFLPFLDSSPRLDNVLQHPRDRNSLYLNSTIHHTSDPNIPGITPIEAGISSNLANAVPFE